MKYLYDLLVQLGTNPSGIRLCCAYIGGGTIQQHVAKIKDFVNAPSTLSRVFYNANGQEQWSNNNQYTHQQIIQLDTWDLILLQQGVTAAAQATTYDADLDYLINYVQTNATNPNFKLGWNMTWASATISTNWPPSMGNQLAMYNGITNAVQTKILTNNNFDFVVPTGTAIQNMRAVVGDVLNSDDIHLNDLGAYVASCLWIRQIVKVDVSKLTIPYQTLSVTIDSTMFNNIKNAVNNAYNFPFEVKS